MPYRNSTLTLLLQDSLGGDSKTLMLLQIAPEDEYCDESTNSLNFGARVRASPAWRNQKCRSSVHRGMP